MSKSLVQIKNITISFNPVTLFDRGSLSIHDGDRIALVGNNGSGKSSLLKVLVGELTPDSGQISKSSDLRIGYLPQEMRLSDPSVTVRDFLENRELKELEAKMSLCLDDPNRLDEWSELHEKYEQLGGYSQFPLEKMLSGLKLNSELLDLKFDALSSGQQVRAALAKVLIKNPVLLLLDEPTNHLDVEMLQWLETHLMNRGGATLIVSHDRKFINNTCNRLVAIDDAQLQTFGGNYDFYLREKKRLEEELIKKYEHQEDEIKRLKQEIKSLSFSKKHPSGPKDRNKMAYDKRGEKHQKSLQRQLGDLKARLHNLETHSIAHPKPKSITGLVFASNPLRSSVAISLESASMQNRILYKSDRIILTGPNGSGKTTLLRRLCGQLELDKGTLQIAQTAKLGYLDQDVKQLPMKLTPLEYFDLTEENLRRELHKAGLGGAELLHKPFASMSVGQRKRLALLSLILAKPNVLLLDEPTNHLDLATVEALETALLRFDGAMIAVSHDRTFIEKIATDTWRLP